MLEVKLHMTSEIGKLNEVIKLFDAVCQKANLPHYKVFMVVAEREGITMPELCKILNMPQGSLSRTVSELAVFDKKGARGPSGLIESGAEGVVKVLPDSVHKKRFAVFLTKKGKTLRDDILKVMRASS